MKVIIAGGRDFTDYNLVKTKCDYYLSNAKDIEIVSGRCSTGALTFIADDDTDVFGADGLGERYAEEKGYKVKKFPADWTLGNWAGPKRNAEMAFYAEALIAFHDGKSRGTENMIITARERGLLVKVVNY